MKGRLSYLDNVRQSEYNLLPLLFRLGDDNRYWNTVSTDYGPVRDVNRSRLQLRIHRLERILCGGQRKS